MTTRTVSALLLLLVCLLAPAAAAGQEAPDTTLVLDAVEVTAAPFALEAARAPLALSVRVRSEADLATASAPSLDALTRGLPGLWVADREDYALGERVLVRGLGWRAAFGVRGTHVLLDGVPLTLPDGQTMLNVVDAAAVRRVEVVRGPASVFWGSGSGGVLALSTLPEGEGTPGLRARFLAGAYGLARADAAAHMASEGRHAASAWASYLAREGFRAHSAVRLARGGFSARRTLRAGGTLAAVGLLAHMPRAESPGGLTRADAEADPRQTRPAAVAQDAGKRLTQSHLALRFARPLGASRLEATLYGGLRALDNPIVPRYIHLDRRAAGLRLAFEAGHPGAWQVGVGAEAEAQRDDRRETNNAGGQPGAMRLTDQLETVRAGAFFARVSRPLGGPALTATASGRLDVLRYAAADRLGASGRTTRTVAALSPALGLAYRWQAGAAAGLLYANAAGALDAPTTTELGNRPDGAPGFNPDLQPERTWGLEAGLRGGRAAGRAALGLDLAVFAARVERLLLPFEVDDVTYYRNAGRTRHVGLEAALDGRVAAAGGRLAFALAYTWTRARFAATAGGVARGAEVPGFPEHLATWTVSWQAAEGSLPLFAILEGEAAGAYFADDANTAATAAYAVVHIRLALAGLALGRGLTATPFAALRNAFDARYAGSVAVNAFGGRFYEPAAGRHAVAGLTLDLR